MTASVGCAGRSTCSARSVAEFSVESADSTDSTVGRCDRTIDFGFDAPWPVEGYLNILPLCMAVTMFIQQKMAMTKVKDPVQAQQQRFMMIMPVVFTWICLQMPAGMVLYWFVNNLLSIAQQWVITRKIVGPDG